MPFVWRRADLFTLLAPFHKELMAKDYRAICATHTGHHNKSPKDHKQWAAINARAPWVDQELTPLELVEWIQKGLAWTGCHLGVCCQ